jgi:toxin-antitoxin system PIN domain toxin
VIVPDVNLLLYAYDRRSRLQEPAKRWWQDLLDGGETIGLASQTIFGFIRMVTNPRIMRPASDVESAIGAVESWLARPQVERLHPGPRHAEICFRILRELGTAGDLTTDAQLAALAIENNAELHSADTDFGRFSGLRWLNPLAKR